MSSNSANETPVDDGQIDQTLNEIDAVAHQAQLATEADSANAADDAGSTGAQDATTSAEPVEETEEARVEREAERLRRAQTLRDRAKRQRDRGRRELERTFVGVVGLQSKVTINDRALASHFVRFAGLIDNTVYLLGRRGALVLGADKAEKLLEKLQELVQVYVDMGAEALRSTAALVETRSAATLDWVVPTYQNAVLEMDLHIKTKLGAKLVRGAHDWDKAIYNLSILSWNEEAKESQIDEARRNERNALARAFNFTLQIITGLRRATQSTSTGTDTEARPARRTETRDGDQQGDAQSAFTGDNALPEGGDLAKYA